jgi:type I restriction enzyme M protein
LPEQHGLFVDLDHPKQLSFLDEAVIPYIRIKDIQRSQINSGSSWLSLEAAASVDSRWKLKAGDILLSKSGTIGKAGVIRNGGVGGIASSGLFVIRPDQDRLDPHFLLAYLNSKEVKAWMDDRSRGVTIRHLSIRTLEDLPVPIPPYAIQQRVGSVFREHGVDALLSLSQLLTKGEEDPIGAWVNKAKGDLLPLLMSSEDALNFFEVERLAKEVTEFISRTGQSDLENNLLAPWMSDFGQAVSDLQGIEKIPWGPGLLNVLQEAIKNLEGALSLIKGHLPNETGAREMNERLVSRINQACSALVDKNELVIHADSREFSVGGGVELELVIKNLGPLPLRNFHVTTNPDWGSGDIAYLPEKSKSSIALSGIAPTKTGSPIFVSWSAKTIDGRPLNGVREIALNFKDKPLYLETADMELGGSPYICGDPVSPERNDVFFGRDELLEQIRRQITRSGNVVLLEGNRRSGKSSVLFHLVGTDAIPGWLSVYCSLQEMEGSRDAVGVPTAEIFRGMAASIAKGMGNGAPLPDGSVLSPGTKLRIGNACQGGISEAWPFSDFREYLEIVLGKLEERNLSLLLMLDEFDKIQEGIESGVTSPQLPENIRSLLQKYPRFSAILTGSRRLKKLREAYWSALYGLGTRFGVSSLSLEDARRLVVEPVRGRLTFSREAVEKVIVLTAKQPFLLQCLCNRIFDMAAQLKKRSITIDLVDQAGSALVEDNEHFRGLWNLDIGSDRRRLLLALFHKESSSPDPLRLGVIQERLEEEGIEIKEETLIQDLAYLRELELIELDNESGGGQYSLAIPLMGIWIERHLDYSVIKRDAKMETEDQRE